jgi:hypothetical protein
MGSVSLGLEKLMKINTHTVLISGLFVVIGFFGFVETVEADPEGSQRLRGMGGRMFAVDVKDLSEECLGDESELRTAQETCS